jgi:hypothetical protein
MAVLSGENLQERILAFVVSNPRASRTGFHSEQVGVSSRRLHVKLAPLNTLAKLVSCPVIVAGQAPRIEYHLAANSVKFKGNHFVINRDANIRLRR